MLEQTLTGYTPYPERLRPGWWAWCSEEEHAKCFDTDYPATVCHWVVDGNARAKCTRVRICIKEEPHA